MREERKRVFFWLIFGMTSNSPDAAKFHQNVALCCLKAYYTAVIGHYEFVLPLSSLTSVSVKSRIYAWLDGNGCPVPGKHSWSWTRRFLEIFFLLPPILTIGL